MKTTAGLLPPCLALLAACAPVTDRGPGVEPPLPDRSVESAARYEVASADTLVYARVFRGGRLEKLGHNHVVVFDDVRGYVALADEPAGSLFDLAVSSARVTVDPPELRRSQGARFQTELSEQARERTRRNMTDEALLDAAAYPYIMIGSRSIEGSFDNMMATVDITVKDVSRRMTLPVSLEIDGGRLVASGELELLQTEFGIEPFSALGGALKVEDRVEVVFRIVAEEQ